MVGANSTIAQAISRKIVNNSFEQKMEKINLYLVGRDKTRLEAHANDLRVRGARVETFIADLRDPKVHSIYLEKAIDLFGSLDEIYVVHGLLGDQVRAKSDLDLAMEIITVNYTSVVALSTSFIRWAESQKIGRIAIFSSVAGDRGRFSNYIYGSAMAGKTALISGLRAHLGRMGVHVMTVKPGFVDTRMTMAFKKGALWATPEKVAGDVIKSLRSDKDICYTPGFWRLIMLIIVHLPEAIFKKLSF